MGEVFQISEEKGSPKRGGNLRPQINEKFNGSVDGNT
jgi:hypothetical protein